MVVSSTVSVIWHDETVRLVLPMQLETLSIASLICFNRACPSRSLLGHIFQNLVCISIAVVICPGLQGYTESDPSAVPDMSDRKFRVFIVAVCLHRARTIFHLHTVRHDFCERWRQRRVLVGLSRWRNLLKHERRLDASHRLIRAITTARLSRKTVLRTPAA
jgi:hypothetical protein